MHEYINLAFVILAFVIAYGALRRFAPILASAKETRLGYYDLKKKYGRLNNLMITGVVVCTVVLAFALNYVLGLLVTLRLSFLYDVLYIIPPDHRVILFMACCMAFMLSLFIFSRVAYYSTLTDWDEYKEFINQYFRFDAIRFIKAANRMLALFTLLLTLMVFDWYTTFGDEEIKMNNLFGFGERKYEYNSITEIREVKKRANLLGEVADDPFCELTLTDGYQWKNLFIDHEGNEKILQLVLARTNVFKTEAELESN